MSQKDKSVSDGSVNTKAASKSGHTASVHKAVKAEVKTGMSDKQEKISAKIVKQIKPEKAEKAKKIKTAEVSGGRRYKKDRRGPRTTKPELERERIVSHVIACWASGYTLKEIEEITGVSFSTVRRIIDNAPDELKARLEQGKTSAITELIEESLEENLKAMNRIVRVTEDEAWLKTQRAPELGTFFGIVHDKTVRILAAIEAASRRDQDPEISETGAFVR